MKKSIAVVLIGMFYSINLFALSPEIKFDMLKTKLTKQLKTQQYSKAISTMDEIRSLGIRVPKSFDYFEGKALFESGKKAESYSKFEKYVNATGKKGKHYKQALDYLIEAEEAKIQTKKLSAPKVIISMTRHEAYIQWRNNSDDLHHIRYQPEITFSKCQLKISYHIKERVRDRTRYNYSNYNKVEDSLNLAYVDSVTFYDSVVTLSDSKRTKRGGLNLSTEMEKTEQEKQQFKEAIFILKEAAIEHGCKN